MATDIQILLDKLKSTGEAIHIDNVDITWNFNNLLLKLNIVVSNCEYLLSLLFMSSV